MTVLAMDPAKRADFLTEQRRRYDELRAQGMHLNLTRGKPAPAQLDLSEELLVLPTPGDQQSSDGTDVRNYGGLKGVVEMREIAAELLNVPVDNVIAGDNSSLTLMHTTVAFAMLHGISGSQPWFGQGVKFICPVPGYDRHFSICQALGIEMIPVELSDDGLDLGRIRDLLADPLVKGMWLVPRYANPSGYSCSEAELRELFSLPAADDFRIWCDNAYALHHLTDDEPDAQPVLQWAVEAGHPDRVLEFASTSKITFAGSGVSFLAASDANLEWYLTHYAASSIGPNKVNQLAHARFFGDADGVREHMRRHRELLAPKFQASLDILEQRLGGTGVATWSTPKGGYFINLTVLDHTATRVVELAKEAGIALTPAGASYPLGIDPRDHDLRLAPSFPDLDDVRAAMDGVATCVLLAAAERLGSAS